MQTTYHAYDVRSPIEAHLLRTEFAPHAPLVAELVEHSMFLREEGQDLSPVIALVCSRAAIDTFLGDVNRDASQWNLQQSQAHRLDLSDVSKPGADAIVKAVAPLSEGPWVPCVELGSRTLFLLQTPPLPVLGMGVYLASRFGASAVVVEKVRNGLVLVRGPKGELHLHANPSEGPGTVALDEVVALFAQSVWCVDDPRSPSTPDTVSRFELVLREVIAASHGVILAMSRPDRVESALTHFQSHVRMVPAPLVTAGDTAETGSTQTGTWRLRSLLRSVVAMDGAVLFSGDGRVEAYRCFVRFEGGDGASSGGARLRAFRALLSNPAIDAGLYRSQDGATRFFRRGLGERGLPDHVLP